MTTDTYKAEVMIIENLALFNEAVVLFETEIHFKVIEELHSAIADWAQNNGWVAGGDWHHDVEDEFWVAPIDWSDGDKVKGDAFKAKFLLNCLDDESDNFILADLFNVGQTEYGFWVEVVYPYFGGWKSFEKSISAEFNEKISLLEFSKQGKEYFLPVRLKYEDLVRGARDNDYSICFSPIISALDTLKRSKSIFDELFYKASKK